MGSSDPRTAAGFSALAAALSLAIPGAGHALIRRWGQAAVWFALWIAVAVTTGDAHSATALILMIVAAIAAFISARDDAHEASEQPRQGNQPG